MVLSPPRTLTLMPDDGLRFWLLRQLSIDLAAEQDPRERVYLETCRGLVESTETRAGLLYAVRGYAGRPGWREEWRLSPGDLDPDAGPAVG